MTRKYLLMGVLATGAALTMSVYAQEADDGAELEEIVVTGSYLFTGLDSPSPVVVISGDEIVTSAPTDLATYFFDNVTQNNSRDPVISTSAERQARVRSLRTAAIDLRGLGSENTLVLLNGRRTIENPTLNLSGWRQTDINAMVPRIAIGRIELLLDGGSATFGSDAVAGVVNTVTRNDFEGFDFSVDGRFFEEEPSAKNITLSALWGAGNDTSHVIAAIEYHETDRLPLNVALDTATNDPDVDPGTGTGLSEKATLGFVSAAGRGAPGWVDPDCGNPAFGAPVLSHYPAYEDPADQELYIAGNNPFGIPGTGGIPGSAAEACAQASGFNPFQTLQNDTQVILAFVAGEHNFSDRLTAKVELNFSRQRFNDQEFWGDLRNGEQWIPSGPSGQGTEFAIPLAHPGRIWAQDVTVNPTANPNFGMISCPPPGMGPPCVPGPGTVYAFGETLPFLYETDAFQESDLFRAAFTLEGDITGDWHWSVDATAAYNTVRNGIRDTVTRRYPDAINGLGGPNCAQGGSPDPTDPALDPFRGTGQCQYYNPFMSSALPNAAALGLANDAELVDWLTPIRTDVWDAEFYSGDALVTGVVGELPGGPIGVAFGGGVRSDFVSSNADQLVNAGEGATTGVFNDWGGRQKVSSVYGELALPIRDDLNIQLAARYEDYENDYSEVTPKIAALWTPTDALTLRASWGQSFKGPSVVHLTADTIRQDNASQGVTVNGIRYGQGGAISALGAGAYELRANTNLEGQTSDNYSLGFDWSVTDNISFGATYVIIEFKDRISSPNLPTVLGSARCFLDINGIPAKPDGLGGLEVLFVPPPNAPRGGPPADPIWYDVEGSSESGACAIPRNPDPAAIGYGTNTGVLAPVTIDDVVLSFASPINGGFLNVGALDLRANMFWDTAIGMVSFTPNVSIVTEYEYSNPGVDNVQCPNGVCDGVGRTTARAATGFQAMPRWQGNFTTGLRRGDHNIRVTARYQDAVNAEFDDLSDQQKANFTHQEGVWTADISWFWQFNASSSFNTSIRNVASQAPPANSGAFFNRNRRTYSIQYTHSFAN